MFAEQLDLTAQLVRAGGLARGRMALVAIDNLAEVLLYRHMQFTFDASEEMGGRFAIPRYDQRERDRLRRDFDRRVRLAQTEHSRPLTFAYPKPMLNRMDADVFRVAHRYRNGVYHEDRHNDALLDPLARLYLSAVGRAWCRAQPRMSCGGAEERLSELPLIASTATRGVVSLGHTTQSLTRRLLQGLDVDPKDLAARVAADLVERANATDTARRELVRCGLPAEAHAEMLRASELRHLYRADPELVRHQEEASTLLSQLVGRSEDDPADDLIERYREAEESQRRRVIELRSTFRPRLNLATASSTRKAANRLEQLRDLSRILTRYQALDERLTLLEGCLAWIDREWDRYVTTEDEIARGK